MLMLDAGHGPRLFENETPIGPRRVLQSAVASANNALDFESVTIIRTMETAAISLDWCNSPAEAAALGRFFAANIEPSYISHSELQGPRALDPAHWRPGIEKILTDELDGRIRALQRAGNVRDFLQPVFAARRGADLLGLGLISFYPGAPVPYAILEDVIVAAKDRDLGIGKTMLDWVTAEAKALGCVRMFLESGVNNHQAHEFFKREHFSACSVVMMRQL
jgi:ribosomal protein S18 acetylase RimI-like enzyme